MLIQYNIAHDKRFTGIKQIKIDGHLHNVFRVNILIIPLLLFLTVGQTNVTATNRIRQGNRII